MSTNVTLAGWHGFQRSEETTVQGYKIACVAGGFFWLLLLLGSVALGQMFCVDREEMLDRLASEYDEELVEVRVIEHEGLLELLASPVKGTWTVIITRLSGVSCVLAAGKGLDTGNYFLEEAGHLL